jgi:hypothetical protein
VGGGMKLSTGVFVLYADEDSFTFMTPQGHMFAGFDVDAEPETSAVCVDKRRQWGQAGNVRHSSAFRSSIRTATSPLRKHK